MNADEAHQQELECREEEEMKESNTILGSFKETLESAIHGVLEGHQMGLVPFVLDAKGVQEITDDVTKAVFNALIELNVRGVAK